MNFLIFALSFICVSAFAQKENDEFWGPKQTSIVYLKDGYVYSRKCSTLESVTSLKDCKAKEELKVVPLTKLKNYLIETRFEYLKRWSKFPSDKEYPYKYTNADPKDILKYKAELEELNRQYREKPSDHLKMRIEIKEQNIRFTEGCLKYKDYLSEQADAIVAKIAEGKEIVSNRSNAKNFIDDAIYELTFKIPFFNEIGGMKKEEPYCWVQSGPKDYWCGVINRVKVGDKVLSECCNSGSGANCEEKVREVVAKGLCKYEEPVMVPVEDENSASINNRDRSQPDVEAVSPGIGLGGSSGKKAKESSSRQ